MVFSTMYKPNRQNPNRKTFTT